MAETLHGRFTGIDLDQLVDRRVVLTWLYWGMFWLIVTPRSALRCPASSIIPIISALII